MKKMESRMIYANTLRTAPLVSVALLGGETHSLLFTPLSSDSFLRFVLVTFRTSVSSTVLDAVICCG